MTDYYTQFSSSIGQLSRDEVAWLKNNTKNDEPFEWGVRGNSFYCWSMNDGDIYELACLVQEFLKKFRPKQRWVMEYALTASKPVPGAFGGGVVIVTCNDITFESTADVVANYMERV